MSAMSAKSRRWLVLLVVAHLLEFLAGFWLGRVSVRAELAELRTSHAETARLQALAAARGLQQAQQRGDALTDALAQRQAQIDQLTQEKHHALHRLTTGRACLSAAAVRVLNQPDAPAGAGPEPLPAPPGGAAAAGGAFATDADVGHWTVAARAQHADCRARLQALIDWHASPTPAEPERP